MLTNDVLSEQERVGSSVRLSSRCPDLETCLSVRNSIPGVESMVETGSSANIAELSLKVVILRLIMFYRARKAVNPPGRIVLFVANLVTQRRVTGCLKRSICGCRGNRSVLRSTKRFSETTFGQNGHRLLVRNK